MTGISNNPYVGPRTFTRAEADWFFGREQEAAELRALVVSERLTLFYAQSGAGKSSLINTRLIPQLQQVGYAVLPIGRVSGELPVGVDEVDNIFVFNLLLNLDQSENSRPGLFSRMTLKHFLSRLTSLDGEHFFYDDSPDPIELETSYEAPRHVLIIDQFEEIVTSHPARWPERESFFQQLNQAMVDDPLLWVVLILREDYVASLEPYAHLLIGKMRARYYMQRMGYRAALVAIKRPAEQAGRPFAPGVAESLVDNLRQIWVHGQTKPQLGQFIEPVQLQVVCYQLWENLREQPLGQITLANLEELGNVDTALAQFYEQALADAVITTGVSEIELRRWFDDQLITEVGTRGAVYRGLTQTEGMANHTVDFLASRFLLRVEVRAGGTWYELIHDRFIEPIRQANQTWRLKQPLIQVAQAWVSSGRSKSLLLEGQLLEEALASNWQGLGPLVQEFLEASQAAQQVKEEDLRRSELEQAQTLAESERRRAEEQVKATKRLRRLVITLVVVLLLTIGTTILAWYQQQRAEVQEQIAQTRAAEAAAAQQMAVTRQVEAEAARQTAEAGRVEVERALAVAEKALEILQATATPTPTPTATPTSQAGPFPNRTSTVTPTPLPTPTPDQAATATLEALRAQVAEIQRGVSIAEATAQYTLSEKWATQVATSDNGLIQISQSPSDEYVPSFSADQTLLLFEAKQSGDFWQIFTIDLKSGQQQQLTNDESNHHHPRSLPDGRHIAFSSDANGNQDIYSMSLDNTTDRRQLTDNLSNDTYPSFSEDGQQIVFFSFRSGSSGVYVMDAEGDNQKVVIDTDAGETFPYISPDGKTVAYQSDISGNWEIYVIPLTGGEPRRLTHHPARDANPVFSPDGRQIVFETNRDGNYEIYVMDADGNNPRNLTNFPAANDQVPAVSPDGQWVVFQSDRSGSWDIFLLPVPK